MATACSACYMAVLGEWGEMIGLLLWLSSFLGWYPYPLWAQVLSAGTGSRSSYLLQQHQGCQSLLRARSFPIFIFLTPAHSELIFPKNQHWSLASAWLIQFRASQSFLHSVPMLRVTGTQWELPRHRQGPAWPLKLSVLAPLHWSLPHLVGSLCRLSKAGWTGNVHSGVTTMVWGFSCQRSKLKEKKVWTLSYGISFQTQMCSFTQLCKSLSKVSTKTFCLIKNNIVYHNISLGCAYVRGVHITMNHVMFCLKTFCGQLRVKDVLLLTRECSHFDDLGFRRESPWNWYGSWMPCLHAPPSHESFARLKLCCISEVSAKLDELL